MDFEPILASSGGPIVYLTFAIIVIWIVVDFVRLKNSPWAK